jgi:hypothetical protein
MYAYFTFYIRNLTGKNTATTNTPRRLFFKYYKYIFLQGMALLIVNWVKIHATYPILLNKIEHLGSIHRLHSLLHFQCNIK